jgi:predicted nucleotidyltransferase
MKEHVVSCVALSYRKEALRMIMTDEITTIRDRIIEAVPVEKIYLFGSYAYGTPKEESDYDFYVVIPNGSMRPVEAMQCIYRSMRGIKRKPMDVLAGTAETFERRSRQLTLERTIAENGVVLYEKPRVS